jgi:hypothetical protein
MTAAAAVVQRPSFKHEICNVKRAELALCDGAGFLSYYIRRL